MLVAVVFFIFFYWTIMLFKIHLSKHLPHISRLMRNKLGKFEFWACVCAYLKGLLIHVIFSLPVDTEQEKLPTPLLLTLRSVYREGQVTAAVRELEVGCIHSSQPHNKKVHFFIVSPRPEDTHLFHKLSKLIRVEIYSPPIISSVCLFSSCFLFS